MPETTLKQVRKWACHKLECFADFIEIYARRLSGNRCCYLELYAGDGTCACQGKECSIDDSPLRAMRRSKNRFERFIFVVRDAEKAASLKELCSGEENGCRVEVITGNSFSEPVLSRLFDLIPRSSSSFALIDPPGYSKLRWSTIRKLAEHGRDWQDHKMDLLIIFPLEMALLRNLTRPQCEASITRLYGNTLWQDIRQEKIKGETAPQVIRQRLVDLFKKGLKELGYRYVKDFVPARFSNPPFYHVILASDCDTRIRTLKDTWSKMRYLPCELLYGIQDKTVENPAK